jgi:hypothetical protein
MKRNKLNLYYVLFAILFLSTILYFNVIERFTAQALENFDIVIIAGQSNGEGYGRRNETSQTLFCAQPHNIDAPSKFVQHYQNDGTIENAVHPICHFQGWSQRKRREPRYTNRGGTSLTDCNPVGFGIDFGKQYYNNMSNGRKVLLVGCAYGGTGFFNAVPNIPFWWEPNDDSNYKFVDSNGNTRNGLVRSLYLMTKTKLNEVRAKVGPESKVVALLWQQGESDARDDLPQYRTKIQTLFTTLRNDIKTTFPNSSSNVPILMGGICPDVYRNRITGVESPNSAMKAMSYYIRDSIVPTVNNCRFVSAEPMTGFNRFLQGNSFMSNNGRIIGSNDNIHFSATSQRELGRRYFSVFRTM